MASVAVCDFAARTTRAASVASTPNARTSRDGRIALPAACTTIGLSEAHNPSASLAMRSSSGNSPNPAFWAGNLPLIGLRFDGMRSPGSGESETQPAYLSRSDRICQDRSCNNLRLV